MKHKRIIELCIMGLVLLVCLAVFLLAWTKPRRSQPAVEKTPSIAQQQTPVAITLTPGPLDPQEEEDVLGAEDETFIGVSAAAELTHQPSGTQQSIPQPELDPDAQVTQPLMEVEPDVQPTPEPQEEEGLATGALPVEPELTATESQPEPTEDMIGGIVDEAYTLNQAYGPTHEANIPFHEADGVPSFQFKADTLQPTPASAAGPAEWAVDIGEPPLPGTSEIPPIENMPTAAVLEETPQPTEPPAIDPTVEVSPTPVDENAQEGEAGPTETPLPTEEGVAEEVPGEAQSTVVPEGEAGPGPLTPPSTAVPEAQAIDYTALAIEWGSAAQPSGEPGGTMTLAIPLIFQWGDEAFESNADGEGVLIPFDRDQPWEGFDQTLAGLFSQVSIHINKDQGPESPLSLEGGTANAWLIHEGNNRGYAVLSDLGIAPQAKPGESPISFTVQWTSADGEQAQSVSLTLMVKILPQETAVAPTPTGTGGETGGNPTPAPEPNQGQLMTPSPLPDSDIVVAVEGATYLQSDGKLIWAIPIDFHRGDLTYSSNVSDSGDVVPFEPGQAATAFAQSILDEMNELSVTILDEQGEDFPLGPDAINAVRSLFQAGENQGYVVFDNLPLSAQAVAGHFSIQVLVTWVDAENGRTYSEPMSLGMTLPPQALPLPDSDVVLRGDGVAQWRPDGTLTWAIPIRYTRGDITYDSNNGILGNVVPFQAGRTAQDFDQTMVNGATDVFVTIGDQQGADFPLIPEAGQRTQSLIQDGINLGYVVFDHLPISQEAQPGDYAIQVWVNWVNAGDGKAYTKAVSVSMTLPPDKPMPLGEVTLGEYDTPLAHPGGTFTLALPIHFTRGGRSLDSNLGEGGDIVAYDDEAGPEDFDQAILAEVLDLTITIPPQENGPLGYEAINATQNLIVDGENQGYVVFEDLPVGQEVGLGNYAIPVEVTWTEAVGGQRQSKALTVPLTLNAPGTVDLGAFTQRMLKPGHLLTMALPVVYTDEATSISSYANPSDNGIVAYSETGQTYAAFNQVPLLNQVSALSITIPNTQDPLCPIDTGTLPQTRELIVSNRNQGYLVFKGLPVRRDMLPGVYPLQVFLEWTEKATRQQFHKAVTLYYEVGYYDIVFTFDELKEAIEDRGLSTIYLGHCAAAPAPGERQNNGVLRYPGEGKGGILIPTTTAHLTLIGTDPRNGQRVLLVDSSGAIDGDTLRVTGNGQAVTLRDMDIEEHHYHGIVYGGIDVLRAKNTTVYFTNIHFKGVQMAKLWGEGSLVVFENVTADMVNDEGRHYAEEVSESASVLFRGKNKMTRMLDHNTAMFRLTTPPYYAKVEAGAQVELASGHYLFYPEVDYYATIDIEGKLTGKVTGLHGCFTYDGKYFDTVNIPKGGELNLVHNDLGSLFSTLRTRKLNVEGSLIIEKKGSGAGSCLFGFSLPYTFNNPELISITNNTTNTTRVLIHYVIPFTYTTQVVNLWPTPNPQDKRIWNNADLSPFTISGYDDATTMLNFKVAGLSNSNKGVALQANNTGMMAMDNTTFSTTYWYKPYRLVMGQYDLTVDYAQGGEKRVIGKTPSNSSVVVKEFNYTSTLGTLIQTSGSVAAKYGKYDLNMPNALKSGNNRIYALSNNGVLEAHTYFQRNNALLFVNVPTQLSFNGVAKGKTTQLISPNETDWRVEIEDLRANLTPFDITLRLDGPLLGYPLTDTEWADLARMTPEEKAAFLSKKQPVVLPEQYLVYIRDDGHEIPLSQQDQAVAVITYVDTDAFIGDEPVKDSPSPKYFSHFITLTWDLGKGIMLKLPPGVGEANIVYSANLIWKLKVAQ